MDKMKMETANKTLENLAKLKEMFPEVITESKDENGEIVAAVDAKKLEQLLSTKVIEGDECYDFTWVGKKQAMVEACKPIRKTLRPCREESVNWENTQNLYIEGDNLDVLKLLQESYLNKIKMIYIDPPYNTGNDSFIYPDDYKTNKDQYDEEVGAIDESGYRMFKNTETNGRFHSSWCSMMYPRLKLARNLLTEDGVIFISIDDNEVDNLKKMCDEVFGAENHVETFNIQVRYDNKSLNEKDDFQKLMEYILIYTKNKPMFIPKKTGNQYDLSKFCFKITELEEGEDIVLGGKNVKIFKDGQYKIEKVDNFGTEYLKATWASGSVLKGNTSGKFFDTQLSLRKDIDGLGVLYKVMGIGEDGLGYRYFTGPKKADATKGLFYSGVPLDRLEELKNGNAIKYNPIINFYDYSADFGNIRQEGGIAFNSGKKPIKMLKNLLNISNLENDDIIMDFFSGSSSTAHAVMQLNAEDGGNRKFIMVQLPEICDEKSEAYKAGYKNICEIGKERIRRAGKKIVEETGKKDLDIGFRVLKLDSSNMKDVYYAPADYKQTMLEKMTSNIEDGRTAEDLLYACMLEWGLELSLPHKVQKIAAFDVHIVNNGDLVACFDDKVSEEAIKQIAEMKPLRAVFRDSSFATDAARVNVGEIFKLKSPNTTIKVL